MGAHLVPWIARPILRLTQKGLSTGSTLDTFRCFDARPKFGHSGVPEIPVTHAALCVSFSIQGATVETRIRQVCVN